MVQDQKFTKLIEDFPNKLTTLVKSPSYKYDQLLKKKLPERGIYLFSQGTKHLYVGRTQKNILKRIQAHVRKGVKDSPFAFKLAREKTGNIKADYNGDKKRKHLLNDKSFSTAYNQSKNEIKEMDIRFIEVTDPCEQTLFEVYVHMVLETKYNDFDTH